MEKIYEVTFVPKDFGLPINQLTIKLPVEEKAQFLVDQIKKIQNANDIILVQCNKDCDSDSFQIIGNNLKDITQDKIYAYEVKQYDSENYRTLVTFSHKKKQIFKLVQSKSKIGVPEILDIKRTLGVYELYQLIYQKYMEDFLTLKNSQTIQNLPFQIKIIADQDTKSVILALNNVKQADINIQSASNKPMYCKFCGKFGNCINGHYLNQEQIETIDQLLWSNHFKIKIIFNDSVDNLEQLFKFRTDCTISQNILDTQVYLSDCLNKLQQPELLEGQDKIYCKKCQGYVEATKQIQLYRVPEIFIIQLKRFNQQRKQIKKNSRNIFYPATLDLKDFLPQNYVENTQYQLYAVNLHKGDTQSGHYKALAKVDDEWYCFNDSKVSKCKTMHSENAYGLFYQRLK